MAGSQYVESPPDAKTPRHKNPCNVASWRRATAPSGAYWHFGSPSLRAGELVLDPMKIAHVFVVLALVMFDFHPSVVVARPDNVFPVVSQYVAEPDTGVQDVVA